MRGERLSVFQNFLSLTFLQAASYLLPLVTLPYLVRVLGPEKFGLIAFAQSIIRYFLIFTDFGFNLSATRQISISRDDSKKISEIFSSVIIIKFFIAIISIIILIFAVTILEKLNSDKLVYLFTSLSIIGSAFFPQWFFQGIEKMKEVAIINIIAKILFAVSIFIFIKYQDDYLLFCILNSVSIVIPGIIAFIIAFRFRQLNFHFPGRNELLLHFKEGFYIFVSNVSMNLYTTSNSVLLGFLTNNIIVGYYVAAEKIFTAFQQLGMPLFQALFPYFSKLFIVNRDETIRLFNKIFRITILITFFISLGLTFFSPWIVNTFLGQNYSQSILILTILSWILLVSWGNYILGIQGLINFGYKKIFTMIVLYCGLTHIIILYICIKYFGFLAVPIVWLFTESLIFLIEYRFLKKLKIIK